MKRMVEGAWRRRLLGLAVATVVPIAVGGAACSGTDVSPEPVAGAAGVVATSGSSAGGSSAGKGGASGSDSAGTAATAGSESAGGSTTAGNAAGGNAAAGSATAGNAAGGHASGGNAAGGQASGGATAGGFPSGGNAAGGHAPGEDGSCCAVGDTDACSADGKALKRCITVPGGECPERAFYSHVWQVQVCANGCVRNDDSGGTGGTSGMLGCH